MPDAEPASVLDASALIAFLHDEPGSEVVVDAVAVGAAVSMVNWAETLSKVAADGGDPPASRWTGAPQFEQYFVGVSGSLTLPNKRT